MSDPRSDDPTLPAGPQRAALPTDSAVDLAGDLLKTSAQAAELETVPAAMRSSSPAARSPVDFGRYRLLDKLGKGGMGVVWKAYDTQLKRVVALKQILAGEEEPETAERFVREAQAAARLRHPNIVGVHEAGVIEGHHFLTTEYVEGKTLRDVTGARPLVPKMAIELVKQVAEALAYAHDQGIVHRDVKPENILVDAQGKAFVMDFGLAKDLRRELGRNLTISGSALGTPAYMSPEQARGWKDAMGPPTDQFSLGVVLYELLTGKLPFDGTSWPDLSTAIVEKDPVRPTRLNPRLHRDLETICLKALEKDPLRRYDSMAALAADLGRWLEGEPIAARPVSIPGRLWRKAVRHRRVVVPFAVLALAALVGLGWAVAASVRKAADEQQAERLLADGDRALELAQRSLYYPKTNYEELKKRVEVGKKRIEEAIGKAPEKARGRDLLGKAWKLLGWEDEAEGCWREAIRLDPEFGEAHFHLGMLLLEQAIVAKAIHLTGVSREEQDKRAAVMLSDAEKELALVGGPSWAGEDEVSMELLRVARPFVAGEGQRVIELAAAAVERFGDREGCERFHVLAAMMQESDAQLAALNRALRVCPHDGIAAHLRANALEAKGDHDGAIADYTQALVINPRNAAVFADRGSTRYDSDDFDGAIADYDQAIAINPRFAIALYGRGNARRAKGELDRAIADYGRAIAIDARFAEAFNNRGVARNAKGDHDGAIDDCDQALAINPRYVDPFINRGGARWAKGDLDGATADFNEALKIDPKNAISHYNLACSHARRSVGKSGANAEERSVSPQEASRHRDSAFDHLSKAIDLGWSDIASLRGDPDLAPLHDDPRWIELLKRLSK